MTVVNEIKTRTSRVPTMEEIFSGLREMGLTFNSDEIILACFHYAHGIARVDAINTNVPENKGFLEYVMRVKALELLNVARNKFSELGTLGGGRLRAPSEEEIQESIRFYLLNPLSPDTYMNFLRAKSRGEV